MFIQTYGFMSIYLVHWFSTWGREPFLEGSGVDMFYTQLCCNCFIQVLDGDRWVLVDCYNGLQCKKG